jgi:hypothetical protein
MGAKKISEIFEYLCVKRLLFKIFLSLWNFEYNPPSLHTTIWQLWTLYWINQSRYSLSIAGENAECLSAYLWHQSKFINRPTEVFVPIFWIALRDWIFLFTLCHLTIGSCVHETIRYILEWGTFFHPYSAFHEPWYTVPPITYYWTGFLILDHSYLVGNLKNSTIAETKVLEPLKFWHFCINNVRNVLISQRDMSGPKLGALSNNWWSWGI